MKNRRGEVATIFTISALMVVGVTALISSYTLSKKQTTSAKAACPASQCSTGTSCVDVGKTSGNYVCCAARRNPKNPQYTWATFSLNSVGCLDESRQYNQKIQCSGEGMDTSKSYYQCDDLFYSDVQCTAQIDINSFCKKGDSSEKHGDKVTCSGEGEDTSKSYYQCGTLFYSDERCTRGINPDTFCEKSDGKKCGSEGKWDCPIDKYSNENCITKKGLEFGCCVVDTDGCEDGQTRTRWYGCTGQPCENTKIGGNGYLEVCPVTFAEGKCTGATDCEEVYDVCINGTKKSGQRVHFYRSTSFNCKNREENKKCYGMSNDNCDVSTEERIIDTLCGGSDTPPECQAMPNVCSDQNGKPVTLYKKKGCDDPAGDCFGPSEESCALGTLEHFKAGYCNAEDDTQECEEKSISCPDGTSVTFYHKKDCNNPAEKCYGMSSDSCDVIIFLGLENNTCLMCDSACDAITYTCDDGTQAYSGEKPLQYYRKKNCDENNEKCYTWGGGFYSSLPDLLIHEPRASYCSNNKPSQQTCKDSFSGKEIICGEKPGDIIEKESCREGGWEGERKYSVVCREKGTCRYFASKTKGEGDKWEATKFIDNSKDFMVGLSTCVKAKTHILKVSFSVKKPDYLKDVSIALYSEGQFLNSQTVQMVQNQHYYTHTFTINSTDSIDEIIVGGIGITDSRYYSDILEDVNINENNAPLEDGYELAIINE